MCISLFIKASECAMSMFIDTFEKHSFDVGVHDAARAPAR